MDFSKEKQMRKFKADESTLFPLSPSSEGVHNSVISLTILAVVELETLVDEFEMIEIIRHLFLPLNIRFSSVIAVNKKGKPSWKEVDVQIENHIRVPTFSSSLSNKDYDEQLREYVSSIAGEPLLESQPLWEIHVIKYPTMYGASSLVFKFSHALGDGYSIISVLFSAFRRADDPCLPLTLPHMSLRETTGKKIFSAYVSKCINTLSDLTFSVLKGSVLEDSKSVIRSGTLGVEFEPISICTFCTSLERLKRVKSKVGGTLNDVVTGAIYYTLHLYMVRKGGMPNGTNMNLLVMFNTRMLRGFKSVDEMLKANIWGNHVGFLSTPIPSISGERKANPLLFITIAKENMERSKNSMLTHLTTPILSALTWIRGAKGVSQYIHSNFRNTTTTITSLIGPKEKMAMAGHPVGSCYFFVAGIPQSLVFTLASCMGQLRIAVTMEKSFIDSELFTTCMTDAFEDIYDAAIGARAGT
ncbi:hypothetical protein ACHQM5_016228 [Ranunculus cassubicifolius]